MLRKNTMQPLTKTNVHYRFPDFPHMSHEKQCKNNKINLSILQEMLKLLCTHTALFK